MPTTKTLNKRHNTKNGKHNNSVGKVERPSPSEIHNMSWRHTAPLAPPPLSRAGALLRYH